jgi:hypothetical protein
LDITTSVTIDVFLKRDGINLISVTFNTERQNITANTNYLNVFGATLAPVKQVTMNPTDPSGTLPMTWVAPGHYSGSITMSSAYQALSVNLDFAYYNPYEVAWLDTPTRSIISE